MQQIYTSKYGSIFSRIKIPKKEGDYVYFIQIGTVNERLFKVGTTNNVLRRMKEHNKYYKKDIYILWVSPCYSKYTTLRVEDNTKKIWSTLAGFTYKRNDRFIISPIVTKVEIKVRKIYEIALE